MEHLPCQTPYQLVAKPSKTGCLPSQSQGMRSDFLEQVILELDFEGWVQVVYLKYGKGTRPFMQRGRPI